MKHRSSIPLACATLSLSLGLASLIAPPILRAQAAEPTPNDAELAVAVSNDAVSNDAVAMKSEEAVVETPGETSPGETSTTETARSPRSQGATSTATRPSSTRLLPLPMVSTEAVETEVAETAPSNPEAVARATGFIAQALSIAEKNSAARVAVVRGAASLVSQTGATWREGLTSRWLRLVQSPQVSRNVRSDAYAAFFEAATRVNRGYARRLALQIPDASARVSALLALSQDNGAHWTRSVNYIGMARRAALQETDSLRKARALTFIAVRLSSLDPVTRESAVLDAWTQTRRLASSRARDYLLAENVGAAAKFDMKLATRIAAEVSDANLKNLAQARINMAELSQTLLTASSTDRVAALAKAVVRYDVRAVPILIQLPPQADVLKALSDSLPPIYVTARHSIDADLLERMWNYSVKATPSVQRDELQSRLARLMVTQDVWRGRSWGKSLAWKGGRVQVGAFIKAVLQSRRAQVKAMSLQDVAKRNVDAAIKQAQTLPPVARAEALLLIAGQLLETPTS